MSFVICHSSFVICHLSFVIRHSSFVICHLSFVIRHSSFVIRHSSFVIIERLGLGGFSYIRVTPKVNGKTRPYKRYFIGTSLHRFNVYR
ncbi:hypothetical protein [Coleofasciculus sp. F4-SAH-05]|uniref:hypothetical protein n=1 Tax=Coleofasciculus sp. F4-SAH-05 TaxID=3069525 RepID=UPI0032F504EF